MPYVIGIDSSTTATKAIVVDETGMVVATGVSEYDFEAPHPQWSEQDPGLWWTATQEAILQALTGLESSEVAAVGLTGQMHGLVLLDDNGDVIRPAILWNDQRTGPECDEIRTTVGFDRLIQITGNDALTGFTAPKILWVRNHEPAAYARTAHILLPKDYVRLQLTGEYASDRAGGAGTLLFDHGKRTWSNEIVSDLEIDPIWLPETFEGPDITGYVTATASAATGLPVGTPVVAGGGDQAATAVGTGAVDPGIVTLSLGTSGVVFAATAEPTYEPRGLVHAFVHAVPDRWHMMGVMLSAAGSLRWYRNTLAAGAGFADLDAEAAEAPPGSDGLLFLPYLTGERSPHPDPLARGGFVGLTIRHERKHLTRSVMEGVAFGLADSLGLMVDAGIPRPSSVRISGGGAKSALWRQIIADVFEATVETVNAQEGAAYGAAVLAAVGAKWHRDARTAVDSWIAITDTTAPSEATDLYRDAHEQYRVLYPALKSTFAALADLENQEPPSPA